MSPLVPQLELSGIFQSKKNSYSIVYRIQLNQLSFWHAFFAESLIAERRPKAYMYNTKVVTIRYVIVSYQAQREHCRQQTPGYKVRTPF